VTCDTASPSAEICTPPWPWCSPAFRMAHGPSPGRAAGCWRRAAGAAGPRVAGRVVPDNRQPTKEKAEQPASRRRARAPIRCPAPRSPAGPGPGARARGLGLGPGGGCCGVAGHWGLGDVLSSPQSPAAISCLCSLCCYLLLHRGLPAAAAAAAAAAGSPPHPAKIMASFPA
jgi:hypothetical protein